MNDRARSEIGAFMSALERRNPGEPEFHQAVREVMETLILFTLAHPRYRDQQLLERLTEPDRTITFRATWEDDAGHVHVRHR